MEGHELINPAPVVHARRDTGSRKRQAPVAHSQGHHDDLSAAVLLDAAWRLDGHSSTPAAAEREPIDALEVFEHIRDITDPEHPYSLEQLNVVEERLIDVNDAAGRVKVQFTPTVAHCSMATLIGLCIRVKLLRSLPTRFKVDIQITPGAHSSEAAVNKQLNDKERVAAALENPNLLDMVNRCLASSEVDEPPPPA